MRGNIHKFILLMECIAFFTLCTLQCHAQSQCYGLRLKTSNDGKYIFIGSKYECEKELDRIATPPRNARSAAKSKQVQNALAGPYLSASDIAEINRSAQEINKMVIEKNKQRYTIELADCDGTVSPMDNASQQNNVSSTGDMRAKEVAEAAKRNAERNNAAVEAALNKWGKGNHDNDVVSTGVPREQRNYPDRQSAMNRPGGNQPANNDNSAEKQNQQADSSKNQEQKNCNCAKQFSKTEYEKIANECIQTWLNSQEFSFNDTYSSLCKQYGCSGSDEDFEHFKAELNTLMLQKIDDL